MTIEFTHEELKNKLCFYYNLPSTLGCFNSDDIDMSVTIPTDTIDSNKELTYKFSFIKKEDIQ